MYYKKLICGFIKLNFFFSHRFFLSNIVSSTVVTLNPTLRHILLEMSLGRYVYKGLVQQLFFSWVILQKKKEKEKEINKIN